MDLMGGMFSQIGNWIHDWATSAWKQDKAGDMMDHAQNFARDQQWSAQAFSERMFKNRYQMETADLMKAGLNPMLAYIKGGGQSPSGSPVGASSPSVPAFSNSGNSLVQSLATAAQIKLINAQADNVAADTKVKEGIPAVQTATIMQLNSQALQLDAYASLNAEQKRQVQATIDKLGEEITNLKKEGIHIEEKAILTRLQQRVSTEERLDIRVRRVLNMLDLPQAVNDAMVKVDSDYFKNVAPYTGELGKWLHSAGEARDLFRRKGGITIQQGR